MTGLSPLGAWAKSQQSNQTGPLVVLVSSEGELALRLAAPEDCCSEGLSINHSHWGAAGHGVLDSLAHSPL